MAKVTKFGYIIIHFLSLFFLAMNVAGGRECHANSHCVGKITCVLPQKPECWNYACVCYDSNTYR